MSLSLPSFQRSLRLILSGAILFTQVFCAHAAESSLWEERRRARSAGEKNSQDLLMARLPSAPSPVFSTLPPPSSQVPASRVLTRLAPLSGEGPITALLAALPPVLGDVRRVVLPAGGAPARIVVLVQDVHANEEAQRNIAGILHRLTGGGGASFVGLEGAFAPIDIAPFRAFPDQAAVRDTADYFLKQGWISGPAWEGILGETSMPLVGIDDPAHYRSNVRAYLDSAPRIKEYQDRLAARRAAVEAEKKKVFSAALQSFDAQVQAYRDGRLSLSDYIRAVAVASGGPTGPDTASFLRALDMERGLDFKRVGEERTRLLEALAGRCSKGALDELARLAVAYRSGELRHGDFYRGLRSFCEAQGVRLSDYPAVDAYIRYALASDAVDAQKLFRDMTRLETVAYAALARTPDEKKLVALSERLHLTGKLMDFSLTPEEWEDYARFSSAPTGSGERDGSWDLSSFASFYKEAQSRNEAIAGNVLKEMDARAAKTAVLVVGGFHTEGVVDLLARSGAAAVVVTPALTKVDASQGSAYLSVFAREKTPLEKLFSGQKLFLAVDPLSPDKKGLFGLVVGALALVRRTAGDWTSGLRAAVQRFLPAGMAASGMETVPGGAVARLERADGVREEVFVPLDEGGHIAGLPRETVVRRSPFRWLAGLRGHVFDFLLDLPPEWKQRASDAAMLALVVTGAGTLGLVLLEPATGGAAVSMAAHGNTALWKPLAGVWMAVFGVVMGVPAAVEALSPKVGEGVDQAAFLAALVQERPNLLKKALHVTSGNRARAEDLVQETLELAMTSSRQFKGGSLRGWLSTILKNHQVNVWRSERIYEQFLAGNLEAESEGPFVGGLLPLNPERALARAEFIQTIERAMGGMRASFRETLLLYVDGHTWKEIAEIQHVAPGTVLSRINRARQAVARALGAENFRSRSWLFLIPQVIILFAALQTLTACGFMMPSTVRAAPPEATSQDHSLSYYRGVEALIEGDFLNLDRVPSEEQGELLAQAYRVERKELSMEDWGQFAGSRTRLLLHFGWGRELLKEVLPGHPEFMFEHASLLMKEDFGRDLLRELLRKDADAYPEIFFEYGEALIGKTDWYVQRLRDMAIKAAPFNPGLILQHAAKLTGYPAWRISILLPAANALTGMMGDGGAVLTAGASKEAKTQMESFRFRQLDLAIRFWPLVQDESWKDLYWWKLLKMAQTAVDGSEYSRESRRLVLENAAVFSRDPSGGPSQSGNAFLKRLAFAMALTYPDQVLRSYGAFSEEPWAGEALDRAFDEVNREGSVDGPGFLSALLFDADTDRILSAPLRAEAFEKLTASVTGESWTLLLAEFDERFEKGQLKEMSLLQARVALIVLEKLARDRGIDFFWRDNEELMLLHMAGDEDRVLRLAVGEAYKVGDDIFASRARSPLFPYPSFQDLLKKSPLASKAFRGLLRQDPAALFAREPLSLELDRLFPGSFNYLRSPPTKQARRLSDAEFDLRRERALMLYGGEKEAQVLLAIHRLRASRAEKIALTALLDPLAKGTMTLAQAKSLLRRPADFRVAVGKVLELPHALGEDTAREVFNSIPTVTRATLTTGFTYWVGEKILRSGLARRLGYHATDPIRIKRDVELKVAPWFELLFSWMPAFVFLHDNRKEVDGVSTDEIDWRGKVLPRTLGWIAMMAVTALPFFLFPGHHGSWVMAGRVVSAAAFQVLEHWGYNRFFPGASLAAGEYDAVEKRFKTDLEEGLKVLEQGEDGSSPEAYADLFQGLLAGPATAIWSKATPETMGVRMRSYTKLVNLLVRAAYKEAVRLYPDARGKLLLAASGSFARREMIPSSDLDLWVVMETRDAKLTQAFQFIRKALSPMKGVDMVNLEDLQAQASQVVAERKEVSPRFFRLEEMWEHHPQKRNMASQGWFEREEEYKEYQGRAQLVTRLLEMRPVTDDKVLWDRLLEIKREAEDNWGLKGRLLTLVTAWNFHFAWSGHVAGLHVNRPDLKEGLGGVRELQSLEWLDALTGRKLLTREERALARRLFQSLQFLRLRSASISRSSQVAPDVLEGLSEEMADRRPEWISRFHPHKSQPAYVKDVFPLLGLMQDIYALMEQVSDLHQRAMERALSSTFPSSMIPSPLSASLEGVPDEFEVSRGRRATFDPARGFVMEAGQWLGLKAGLKSSFSQDPALVVEAFEASARLNVPLSPETLEAMKAALPAFVRAADAANQRWDKAHQVDGFLEKGRASFLRLMDSPWPVSPILWRMKEMGFLSTLIPELGRLKNLVQLEELHLYAADAHLIKAEEQLESLAAWAMVHDSKGLGRLFTRLSEKEGRWEKLRLTILFHDLGKPGWMNRAHTEVDWVGAHEIVPKALARLGVPEEDSLEIRWLIFNDTLLFNAARRGGLVYQDTDGRYHLDPHFRAAFERARFGEDVATMGFTASVQAEVPELMRDAVYMLPLLDLADSAGTNPKNMAAVLDRVESYSHVLEHLAEDNIDLGRIAAEIENKKRAEVREVLQRSGEEERLQKATDIYFQITSFPFWEDRKPDVIAREIQLLDDLESGGDPVRVLVRDPKTLLRPYEVIIMIRNDQPGLLAKVTGVLTAQGLGILSSQGSSGRMNRVVDRFLVQPDNPNRSIRDLEAAIKTQLTDLLNGKPIREVFPAGYVFPNPRANRVAVAFSVGPAHTLRVQVRTADFRGLLHVLTRILGDGFGLNVHSAAVDTEGPQAMDTFLVTTPAGEVPPAVVHRPLREALTEVLLQKSIDLDRAVTEIQGVLPLLGMMEGNPAAGRYAALPEKGGLFRKLWWGAVVGPAWETLAAFSAMTEGALSALAEALRPADLPRRNQGLSRRSFTLALSRAAGAVAEEVRRAHERQMFAGSRSTPVVAAEQTDEIQWRMKTQAAAFADRDARPLMTPALLVMVSPAWVMAGLLFSSALSRGSPGFLATGSYLLILAMPLALALLSMGHIFLRHTWGNARAILSGFGFLGIGGMREGVPVGTKVLQFPAGGRSAAPLARGMSSLADLAARPSMDVARLDELLGEWTPLLDSMDGARGVVRGAAGRAEEIRRIWETDPSLAPKARPPLGKAFSVVEDVVLHGDGTAAGEALGAWAKEQTKTPVAAFVVNRENLPSVGAALEGLAARDGAQAVLLASDAEVLAALETQYVGRRGVSLQLAEGVLSSAADGNPAVVSPRLLDGQVSGFLRSKGLATAQVALNLVLPKGVSFDFDGLPDDSPLKAAVITILDALRGVRLTREDWDAVGKVARLIAGMA